MTRARGMMAKTAIAHTSAMNCLPGLAARKQSRINFLSCLGQGRSQSYVLNAGAGCT